MSDLKEQSDKFDESLGILARYTTHIREHVVEFAIKIKHFDKDCEACQAEFRRISKKSEKHSSAKLEGEPHAIVSFLTILCFLGMHDECNRNYVLENEKVKLECLCSCHTKPREKAGGHLRSVKNPRPKHLSSV